MTPQYSTREGRDSWGRDDSISFNKSHDSLTQIRNMLFVASDKEGMGQQQIRTRLRPVRKASSPIDPLEAFY